MYSASVSQSYVMFHSLTLYINCAYQYMLLKSPLVSGRHPGVRHIYTSQSLFTIYVHNVPSTRLSRPSIFTGREVPDLVNTKDAYGTHALIKVRFCVWQVTGVA